ncbi:MAG: hypothetical protein C5S41_02045, partial [Candidatus Methanomarinus sp.]
YDNFSFASRLGWDIFEIIPSLPGPRGLLRIIRKTDLELILGRMEINM